MTKPAFDRKKYERLIEVATTQACMRDTLERMEALVIQLSPAVDKFIKNHNAVDVDKFLKVLPYAPIASDLRSFFKVQVSDRKSVQFYMCAYQTKLSAELDTFIVYICTQEEDDEFGIIDTLLQSTDNQLPNLPPDGLPASVVESTLDWDDLDNIDLDDLEEFDKLGG
ncbi:hypothetical protein SNR37_002260 [Agarivorans aestuarii]|uniref:Uncharacterized protein n=1 Tax=Agarivorans aestuarii TaxID=1563703 RepID=A0ABU7G101_9ALTE|nr:hypothetical protein [Agarivorans aestuarii]MEE1672849.1 hypothetical protein [Agarivorans aestuarii]